MTFWKNKKVLVTGGNGFIGSHLVEELVKRNSDVSITVSSKKSNLSYIKPVKDEIKIYYGNLNSFKNCLAATKNQEIVINLAGIVGGIEYNIRYPASIFRGNLTPFMNVLEASRANNVERFLTVSSACVYPRFCKIPTPEEEGFRDRPEPTNEGYGWAKRMQEFLSEAYTKEHGMYIAIARPYNAYGPRDNFDPESSHVIPALIKKVFSGKKDVVVWGNGRQSRSFLYVRDLVEGLLLSAEKGVGKGAINIGSEEETKIKSLIEIIVKLSGKDVKIVFDKSKPIGQPRRKFYNKKAKKVLGFEAKVGLEEGLRNTIEWYKNYKKGIVL